MSRADGEHIKVTFSQPLTQIAVSDAQHCAASFLSPAYVPGGAMQRRTVTPAGAAHYVRVKENADLADGTLTDTEESYGWIQLAQKPVYGTYEELESVIFTGQQYIELTDLPAGCTVELQSSVANTDTKEKCVFGYRASSSAQSDIEVHYKDAVLTLWARGGETYLSPNTTQDIIADTKYTTTFTLLTARSKVFLGKYFDTTTTNYRFKGKVFGLKIWNSENTLILDLMPARRLPDRVIGFYDRVNDEFYTNDGDDFFSPGLTIAHYETFGTAEYSFDAIQAVSSATESGVTWEIFDPTGTTITVQAKLDGGSWTTLAAGDPLPIAAGADLSDRTLYLKITLQSQSDRATPELGYLTFFVGDALDVYDLDLQFSPGNVSSLRNACGDITLTYDGAGELAGEGGPVEAFEETFTPVGLLPKYDPHDGEHIDFTIDVVGDLFEIDYTDAGSSEHIEIDLEASGVLIHVDDL